MAGNKRKDEKFLYLTPEQFAIFRESAYNRNVKWGLFFDMIMQVGFRVSEGLLVTPKDLLLKTSEINATTLKRKTKPMIPIKVSESLLNGLLLYVESRAIKPNKHIFIFTRQRAWQVFKEILKSCKLSINYSPHALRHCQGMISAEVLKDKSLVARRLRHSGDRHTWRYIHLTNKMGDDIVERMEQYNKKKDNK